MEAANTNGYTIDETVTVENHNNNAFAPVFVQYSKSSSDYSLDSMAPRTICVPFGSVCSSTYSAPVSKSAFISSASSLPQKLGMAKQNSGFQHSVPHDFQTSLSIDSCERRLQQIISRHNLAEMRAMRLMSSIGNLSVTQNIQPCGLFGENLSDLTESSSDDELGDESQPSDTWFRSRAILRCHWSLLQSEIVKAMDCLKNLKPLHRRCRKWRRSLPLLPQGGLIERSLGTTSRALPFEKSDKPRHTYYNLSSLTHLDFMFPGSAKPSHVTHPHCQQTFGMCCIYCCPAFNNDTESNVTSPISTIAERSVAIDKSRRQTRRAEKSKRTWKKFALHQTKSKYKDDLPCSSGVSSTSSQDGHESRRHLTLLRSINRQPYHYRSVIDERKKSLDFPYNIFKEANYYPRKFGNAKQIPVPLWRKVSYPSSMDIVKRTEGSSLPFNSHFIHSPQNRQTTCNYRIPALNSGRLEGTAGANHEQLRTVGIAEQCGKVGPSLSFNPLPSSKLPDLP